ncbi:hypothetical protein [Kordiimonas sp. SCSIO 12610]|uniref:hypothetical protein n=1 Tax=Kordiimonas sp. SCSIO 12610 TaxID=2829597 RepID=UPI00210E10C2|nr:hypothetical protein [Kordiimonas sp. SCSIO 12610]UTW54432.1 hypothetical protein KFF44_11510 [Kordiimonas sp. SCSIO 12610]
MTIITPVSYDTKDNVHAVCSGTVLSYQNMMKQLIFLFAQLEPSVLDSILVDIENIYGISTNTEFSEIEYHNKNDIAAHAVIRFFYVILGRPREDIAFAFTLVQIRALELGADDCECRDVYC